MNEWITDTGIVLQGEEIPFQSWIRVYTDQDQLTHSVLFNVSGKERALTFKLEEQEFRLLKERCADANPSCYFQSFRKDERLSLIIVILTVWTVLSLVGAIVCFFRQMRLPGYALIASSFIGMIINIFLKRRFSLMKANEGSDPKRMKRAREANAAYRKSLPKN